MNILVTGGAGFIGSITVKKLLNKGYSVIVFDNLSNGNKDSIDSRAEFIKGDLNDKDLLNKTFKKFNINAVIHFAGFIEAGESMKNPKKYFENNIFNGINLLEVMIENNVKKIIFSSSAGVYASKESLLIEEDIKEPTSVYGDTKLIFERILKWYDKIYGIKHIALRYFNATGSLEDLGEKHNPETHLIPLVILTALGKRDSIDIFGSDYKTFDGTCIRDYIHVEDIADAHILALEKLSTESKIYNIGTGKGNSVKEIIDKVKEISGKDFKVNKKEKRIGDSAILIADAEKAKRELNWIAKHDINKCIKDSFDFLKNLK